MRDETDRKIISLLQANARESATRIAATLGLARTTVQERISRMERDGIIDGYTVILNARPDAPRVQVLILLEVQQKETKKVISRLESYPEIRKCLSINGEYDLCISAEAPQIEDLDLLVDEIGQIPGVIRTNTSVVFGSRIDRKRDTPL
ncbi:Lrp/AsnC family transcriptional regulator [Primorskyibacter sp. S87]|uniref:Lrp/AsnC family transcriptional regulator n=1 Tax=Primorskyibacter sp. S87 TaxID=3415126 RepID=UPI003C7D9549